MVYAPAKERRKGYGNGKEVRERERFKGEKTWKRLEEGGDQRSVGGVAEDAIADEESGG